VQVTGNYKLKTQTERGQGFPGSISPHIVGVLLHELIGAWCMRNGLPCSFDWAWPPRSLTRSTSQTCSLPVWAQFCWSLSITVVIRSKLGMRKGSWEFIMAETCCGKVELSTTSLEKEFFDSGMAYMNGKKGDIELFFGRYHPLIFSDTPRSCRWVISNAIGDLVVCNRRPLVCGMAGKY